MCVTFHQICIHLMQYGRQNTDRRLVILKHGLEAPTSQVQDADYVKNAQLFQVSLKMR